MCYSLLMYLQDNYRVTTTTDLEVLKGITKNSGFDLVIIDSEPSLKVNEFCKEMREIKPKLNVVLTYVYQNKMKELEENIRKYVNTIFYKPFDLTEVSTKLSSFV
jgi:DNA-binding NtrC family response regulator